MKTKYAATALLLSMVALASYAKNLSQVFAQCESDAYGVLGVRTNERASLDYLEKKYELVRVCMLKQGFVFKASYPDSAFIDIYTNAHRRYGMERTPMNQVPPDIYKAIREEIARERVLILLRRPNWN